jgi:hypothetical protein
LRAKDPIDAVPGLDHPFVQLVLCVVIDGVGMWTYLVPGLGELGDVIWAPVQSLIILTMISRERYMTAFVVLSFVEEILPFTDFIPSATFSWLWKHWFSKHLRRR